MSDNLPSIWIEIKQERSNSILVAGFYREWCHEKNKSTTGQVARMEIFCSQIKSAHSSKLNMIILGDLNLDANKWMESDFPHKKVTNILEDSLEENDLMISELGNTYQANHAPKNGEVAESAIDHIYI